MEDGHSLYPWFIFILFVSSYLLRVVRLRKKRKQEQEQKKRDYRPPPPVSAKKEKKPPPPPSLEAKKVDLPPKKTAAQPQLSTLSTAHRRKKSPVKKLIQELPSKKSLILLAEILNRRANR